MTTHLVKPDIVKSLPFHFQQEAREQGATVGVAKVGGELMFCFIFRVGAILEAATMPFEDKPGEVMKVILAINRRTKKNYTETLCGKSLQWIKRSRLEIFDSHIDSGLFSDKDWSLWDSMIYMQERISGKHTTKHQEKLRKLDPTCALSRLARRVLDQKINLAEKIMKEGRDARYLGLMVFLSKALAYFNSQEPINRDSTEFLIYGGITANVPEMLKQSPADWYPQFTKLAREII